MLRKEELVEGVISDLQYLQDEWKQDVDDDSLRRSSPILRRLLVENALQRAWKGVGFKNEPKVNCMSLSSFLSRFDKRRIIMAVVGGAITKAAQIAGFNILKPGMSEEEVVRESDYGLPDEILGLKGFIECPCIIVKGKVIVHRVLIKYIANKLGGVHFDSIRKGQHKEDQLYRALDQIKDTDYLLDRQAIYYEYLSIGQALVNSEDIKKLLNSK